MAKSAKDKLAVDGTAKLAAKSKPGDKHEKKNLTVEEATVESPRPSRKRSGEFFDFGDEADRVAEDLAAEDADVGASKATKTSKKAKKETAEDSAKKAGKKGKAAKGGASDGKEEDAEKPKAKKAKKSEDAAAVTDDAPGGASKKKGQSKKADKADESKDTTKAPAKKAADTKKSATDAKKSKGKETQAIKKAAQSEETIEDRVVKEDKKKQKEEAEEGGVEVDDPYMGAATTIPGEIAQAKKDAKKGKTGKDSADKAKVDGAKQHKKGSTAAPKKSKSESSKSVEKDDKGPAASKTTGKKTEPKGKAGKTKPEPPAKESKAEASTDVAPKASKAKAGGAKDAGPVSADGKKAPKTAKAKSEADKPAKASEGGKGAKKSKDGETAKPKKSATAGEPAKPKKTAKAKDIKPDIADQALQPMDLVEEEAALQVLSKPAASKGKKRKAPSDVAADIVKSDLLDPLAEHAADESAKKKQKKSRKSLGETLGEIVATGADAVRNSFTGMLGGGGDGKPTTTGSSQKQSKGKGKATDADDLQPTINEDQEEDGEDEEEDDAPDDKTAALLAGFDNDDVDFLPSSDAGFQEGSKIPAIPDSAATSKKLKAVKAADNDKPGVVYVGRIPHGFYEHEMRTYFSQFGDVNRLRLSRSVKTGHSKHYAFLEFKNEDVAKIVAQTMDNYLMFGHILKCKVVAPGDVHENMWKGANKRFKKVPWNKIEGRKLEMPVGRDVWKKREEKETKKRADKSKKMMETVGYAFEGTGLKSVDDLPKKIMTATKEVEKSLVTGGGEDQAGAVVVSEEIKEVEVNRGAEVIESAKETVKKVGKRALDGGEEVVTSISKKAKKVKTSAKA